MKKEFFKEEELEALKGGENESPVKSEEELDQEGNGALFRCCNGSKDQNQFDQQ